MRPLDTLPIDSTGDDGAVVVQAPHLFVVLDAADLRAPPARHVLVDVDTVHLGRGETRSAARDGATLRLTFDDRWMSGQHARIVRERAHWRVEDLGSRNGIRIDGAPVGEAVLVDGAVLEIGRTFLSFGNPLPHHPEDEPLDLDGARLAAVPLGVRTIDPRLARRFRELERVCPSVSPILVRGPTGVGKELVARAIHALSGRSGRLVPVNCGALPDKLIESELFGYRKGAFSGADADREGLVVSSSRGTLFLDEIGDLPLGAQAVLLRVLEEGEVRPLGSAAPLSIDLRVVAATHRDLEAMVTEGTFREDLLARLAGFVLDMPPLRERKVDLGIILAEAARAAAAAGRPAPSLSGGAARALLAHDWPRNVRELRKGLDRAFALCADGRVRPADLPPAVLGADAEPEGDPPGALTLGPEDDERRRELVRLLVEHDGNISAVAREMGRVRSQIQRWLKRYRLDPRQFRR